MQNRPPPLAKSHLFAPGANKKGKGRQAPTSMTDASRAHPAPAAGRPQPPPPPPPLASITASGSGSGPPLAPSPQSHRPPSNHHAGPPPPPPPPAGQARPLASLVTPEIRTQVTSAMKLLASITRDQQDRDCLEKAYEWPDLADEERNTLNHKLDLARQAEMAQRDKVIETTYSRLSHDMVVLFSGLVEHATSSRLEGLVRRCDAQQKRIDDLEEAQRGASTTATSSTTAAAADDTTAAAATVAAAQQKRIEDLERKLNTLVQAHAQAQQTTTSSSSPRPAAPPGCPQAYSPTAGGAGASASPPGTPFDPTSSAPADLHATYKELRDKYRYVGNEVRAQKTRIEKLTENVAELQKKLLAPAGQQQQVEEGTGGGGEVFKGLEKRLEKVEQALVATQQQQPPPNGAGNGGATSTGAGGGTVDPRRRPSSTTPADAQAPITAAAAAAAAAEVATLRTDFDAFAARVSSQLGKRSHDGVDSGADHPHKAAKSTEGATPASATAKAGNDDEQQQQVTERLQKVEERLEGCEKKVTALRSDVDKEVSRIDATAVNVADLEKKEKERTEREQAAAAAPPVSKGGSSTSDMDLDKSDEDDQRANANAEKFDVLERRIRQMEASGSPELLIEPVKNEVAELRKLFDERVPLPNTREDPKIILAFIRNLEQSVARSSASAAPVLEALRSFVGTAADGSTLPADQVRSKLLDTLVRMRDDLQRHGTTLASHDRSIKSLVEAGEQTDSKFEALQDLGNLLGDRALPQLRDLYLLVCRAQEMNLFPKTATLFPNANANANANTLAITNGSHGSPTPGASSTTTGAAANAAPNGMGSTASSSSGANPAPQPNGIVGARPPPTTTAATTSSTATTGAHAPAQGRPSATPAAPPSTSTSTSTSTNPSSLPQRPQQPQGQGQQRPGSANGSSSGATPRGRF